MLRNAIVIICHLSPATMSNKRKPTTVHTFSLSFLSKPAASVTTVSEHLSNDHRRRSQKKTRAEAPPPPRKKRRLNGDEDSDGGEGSTTATGSANEPIEVDAHLAGAHIEKGRRGKGKRSKKFYPSVRS